MGFCSNTGLQKNEVNTLFTCGKWAINYCTSKSSRELNLLTCLLAGAGRAVCCFGLWYPAIRIGSGSVPSNSWSCAKKFSTNLTTNWWIRSCFTQNYAAVRDVYCMFEKNGLPLWYCSETIARHGRLYRWPPSRIRASHKAMKTSRTSYRHRSNHLQI